MTEVVLHNIVPSSSSAQQAVTDAVSRNISQPSSFVLPGEVDSPPAEGNLIPERLGLVRRGASEDGSDRASMSPRSSSLESMSEKARVSGHIRDTGAQPSSLESIDAGASSELSPCKVVHRSDELLGQAHRSSDELLGQAHRSSEGASSSDLQGHSSTEGACSTPSRQKKSRRQPNASLLRIAFEAVEEDPDPDAADSDPGPSQEAAANEGGFAQPNALDVAQMTMGCLSPADSDKLKAARDEGEEAAHVHLGLSVPHLLHAGVLTLSGLTSLLWGEGSPPEMLGVALISAYIVSIFSMLALAAVRVLRPHLHLRHPPLVACCVHLALTVLEVQWRVDRDEQSAAAWRGGCLQLSVLQLSAMRLGGSGGWSVAAAVLPAVLGAVMALQGQLSAGDVAQNLLLPGAAMCAAAAHFQAPEAQTLKHRLLAALQEFVIGRGPEALDLAAEELAKLAEGGKEAFAEKATQLLTKLNGKLPDHKKGMLKAVVGLLQETPEARRRQVPSLENAPLEVQEFIMGVLPDRQGARERSASFQGGRGLNHAPRTSTGRSVDEHLARLLHPLRYREHAMEHLGKEQKKATETLVRRQLGRWDVDMIRIAAACANRPLQLVGQAAFQPLVEQLGLDFQAVKRFLVSLECRYRSSNPYHNSTHAADVLNSMVYFMHLQSTNLSAMPHLDVLAALTAAASHDVGHDGKSNRFHMVGETPLSQLFNEQSCLENMHCAITFAILQIKESNIFLAVDPAEWAAFRSSVVQLILDTDLAKHFPFMDAFRRDFLEGTPSMEKPKHRLQLLSAVLKASDVGASAKPFALHAQWTTRINAEFYRQGDEEKQLGLPPSPFCDRAAKNVADSQKGFYQFIVVPLFTDLNGHLMSRRMEQQVLEEVKKNQGFWTSYDSADFNYEQPMESVPGLVKKFNGGLAVEMRRSGPDGAPAANQPRPVPVLAPRFNTRS